MDTNYTVKVKIDKKDHEITYPSKTEHDRLVVECVERCRMPKKKDELRRRFLCLHCNDEDFSNKIRLNYHRWIQGCLSGPLQSNGLPLRIKLLPYPEFLSGKGKASEMLAKGKYASVEHSTRPIVTKRKRSVATSISNRPSLQLEVAAVGGDESTDGDFQSPQTLLPEVAKRGSGKRKVTFSLPSGGTNEDERPKDDQYFAGKPVELKVDGSNHGALVSADCVHGQACGVTRSLQLRRTKKQLPKAHEDELRRKKHEVQLIEKPCYHETLSRLGESTAGGVEALMIKPLSLLGPDKDSFDGATECLQANFVENVFLQRYFRTGECRPPLLPVQSRVIHDEGKESKICNLDEDRKRLEVLARERVLEFRNKLQPPQEPVKPSVTPGLYLLMELRTDLFPWNFTSQRGCDFIRNYEEIHKTSDFASRVKEVAMWWAFDCYYDETLDQSFKDTIQQTIRGLRYSLGKGELFQEVHRVADYLQYHLDQAAYEEVINKFKADMNDQEELILNEARQSFERSKLLELEASVWDWCPIWEVLYGDQELMQELPALPWTHNEDEVVIVWQALTRRRVQRWKPTYLIYVLRIHFTMHYGQFRTLSCSEFGITEPLLAELCSRESEIMNALHLFCLCGRYLLGGILQAYEDNLVQDAVLKCVNEVNTGNVAAIFLEVQKWVRSVRARAIQDIAIQYSDDFKRMWRTKNLGDWGAQHDLWVSSLRKREYLDLGWLPGIEGTQESMKLSTLRCEILSKVCEIKDVIDEDEELCWRPRSTVQEGCTSPPMKTEITAFFNDTVNHGGCADDVTFSVVNGTDCTIISHNQDMTAGMTVTQVQNTVHSGVDMDSNRPAFDYLPVSQFEDTPQATPSNLVSILGRSGILSPVPFPDLNCTSGTPMNNLNFLSQAASIGQKDMTFPTLYKELRIDELLLGLRRTGEGKCDNVVIFFHGKLQNGKSIHGLPIQIRRIRELKKPKLRLGYDIIDFMSIRAYWACQTQRREKLYVTTSRLSNSLKQVFAKPETLKKWAVTYLLPPFLDNPHLVTEIVVPYLARRHWSMFVFTVDRVYHMDSSEGYHKPRSGEDAEFLKWVYLGWRSVIGFEENSAFNNVVTVPVFQQPGNWECGHVVLRNISWLLYGHHPCQLESLGGSGSLWLRPFHSEELHRELIRAIAYDLDPSTPEPVYGRPILQAKTDDSGSPITMVDSAGNAIVVTKVRRTRLRSQVEKERSLKHL